MKEVRFTDTLYDAEISYLIGGTVEDLIAFVDEKHPGKSVMSWGSKFEWGEDANTTNAYQFHINAPLGKGEVFYVWMHELTPYLLGHETFHLTGDILFTRGIKYCEESEEAFAYLCGWLHQQFENANKN